MKLLFGLFIFVSIFLTICKGELLSQQHNKFSYFNGNNKHGIEPLFKQQQKQQHVSSNNNYKTIPNNKLNSSSSNCPCSKQQMSTGSSTCPMKMKYSDTKYLEQIKNNVLFCHSNKTSFYN